jgi:trigger factor
VKVTTEHTPNCQAILTVEVDEDQVTSAMKRAAQKISRMRPIPGFRPGKAPYEYIERAVGKENLREQAIDEVAQAIYKQVLEQENIEPYDKGQVEVAQAEPLILKFTVPTRPVVTLGDYRSIHLTPRVVEVTDAEVDQAIEQLRNDQAILTPVTRPVQWNDRVTVDVRGGIEDQIHIDRQGLELRVDAKESAFPWIEQLVGMTLNEPRTITYTYPENTANAGKVATYTVTVTDIKELQLPNLDDEFAKSVSAFETLEQLRGRIRANLREQKQVEEERRYQEQVLDAVVEQAQVAMPDSMIEDEVEREVNRMKQSVPRLGLTWEKYLQLAGKDEAALRAEMRSPAQARIKSFLVLMQLAEAEQIEVTEKEVDVEIDRRAMAEQARGGRADQVRRELSTRDAREDLEFTLRLNKAMERMIAIAKGEPTSGKIITPEMLRRAAEQARAQAATEQRAPTPSGLITDPSQVRSEDWPRGLERPIIPGQES